MNEPVYLGDGVYLSPGRFGGELILTTGHHEPASADNVVYLDPSVVQNFFEALKRDGFE